jgi:predicted negative regulator of RcsB-dependent stress response
VEEYLSEKEQWEQVTQWLRENGLWIIAGIVVGAAGLAGWRWYQDHLDSVGAAAGAKYTQAVQAFAKSDRTAGFVAIGELERDFPSSPYVDQGRLMAARLARVQISLKKPDAALATLNGLKAGAFEPRMHEVLGDAYYAKGDKTNALKEYMTAKVTDMVAQSLDPQALELKIDDLTAENPHAVAQAVTPAAANPAAK